MNWDIDFGAFKSAKQVVMIPIDNDKKALLKEANKQVPQRNEQDLFNEIEGRRHDVMLPTIKEEVASGTGATEQYRVNENYPLKQPLLTPEVLLVCYPDMKDTLTKKLGFNVKEVNSEQETTEQIEYALKQWKAKKTPFYRVIVVNCDANNLVLSRIATNL